MDSTNGKTVKKSRRGRKFRKTILIPVIVAVIGGVILLLINTYLVPGKNPIQAQPPNPSSAVNNPTSTLQTPTPETPTPETPTPTTPAPAPPSVVSPKIIVKTQIAEPVGDGRKLGPNIFQLGDGGEADIAFSWLMGTANGSRMDDGCQVVVSIEGPQEFLNVETAECSGSFATSFNGSDNGISVETPGSYIVSVKDAVTGATGSTKFTVRS